MIIIEFIDFIDFIHFIDFIDFIYFIHFVHFIHFIDFTHFIDGRYVLEETLQFYRRHGKNVSNWAFDGSDKATMKKVIMPSAGKDLRPAYEKRIITLDVMLQRLNALGTDVYKKLGTPKSFSKVISDIKKAKKALTHRTKMFEYGWFGRKTTAIKMMLAGEYRYFLGWKSFAKDFIR